MLTVTSRLSLTASTALQAPTPLASLSAQIGSTAFGIALNGRIVGEAELASGAVHGVIRNSNGKIGADLGANTSAQAVNDVNRIAGYKAESLTSNRATIWNGADISDDRGLAPALSQAYGLNNLNQIVGFSGSEAFAAIPE